MTDPLAWKDREEPEDPRMDWGPGEWHDETVRLTIEIERLRRATVTPDVRATITNIGTGEEIRMPGPLTIYECPEHGVQTPEDGWRFCTVSNILGRACARPLGVVRVFREDDVRKLWDCCYDASGHHLAPDDFPAPAEWPR